MIDISGESGSVWVPVAIMENWNRSGKTLRMAFWHAAGTSKGVAWDKLVRIYESLGEFRPDQSRATRIAALRKRGFRLLPGKIRLCEVGEESCRLSGND